MPGVSAGGGGHGLKRRPAAPCAVVRARRVLQLVAGDRVARAGGGSAPRERHAALERARRCRKGRRRAAGRLRRVVQREGRRRGAHDAVVVAAQPQVIRAAARGQRGGRAGFKGLARPVRRVEPAHGRRAVQNLRALNGRRAAAVIRAVGAACGRHPVFECEARVAERHQVERDGQASPGGRARGGGDREFQRDAVAAAVADVAVERFAVAARGRPAAVEIGHAVIRTASRCHSRSPQIRIQIRPSAAAGCALLTTMSSVV